VKVIKSFVLIKNGTERNFFKLPTYRILYDDIIKYGTDSHGISASEYDSETK